MTAHLLHHKPFRPAPELRFLGDLGLTRGRAHEFCGEARQVLALIVARACDGPVFWLRNPRQTDPLFGPGLVPWIDPARLIFVNTARHDDTLWAAEEVLRSGQVPLMVAEIAHPPALTPIRRLHLAAQEGGTLTSRSTAPLGLLLCPGDGGAQGVESRWHMRPTWGAGTVTWQLSRLRARNHPPARWQVRETHPGQVELVNARSGSEQSSPPTGTATRAPVQPPG